MNKEQKIQDLQRLVRIMDRHVGSKNGISKESLYKDFYHQAFDESSASKMYDSAEKWKYLRKLMKYLRHKTMHYIVCEHDGVRAFKFYILNPRDSNDAISWNEFLEGIVKGIKKVERRCDDYYAGKLTNKDSILG